MFSKCMKGAVAAIAFGALAVGGAQAQDTVKIGLILAMTGQQATTGKQIEAAGASCGWRRTATRSPARRSR